MEKEYYLCSESIIRCFPDINRSNFFKVGYDDWDDICVAELDFSSVQAKYFDLGEPEDFWCQELVGYGSIPNSAIEGITIASIKREGLLRDIVDKMPLTKLTDIAWVFCLLCHNYGLSYIEMGNKLGRRKSLGEKNRLV